ncbi:MAG TPA: fasciclin domain-containing protein [Nocardioides sp.]|nr:fasciclin domain-containing protein [Nocardioides sp.]
MKMHRTVVGAAVLAASASMFAMPSAQAEAPHGRTTSLAQVLAADGHRFDSTWGDFDVLDKAVATVLAEKPKSPVGVLAKGRTKLTAFLPTDRAFRELVTTLTGNEPRTERAAFRSLARAAGVDVIETVLLYHVVPGRTLGSRQVLQADGAELATAQGGTVTVRVGETKVRLQDADPDVRNPRVIATDINKGNPQVAHAINGVLLPLDV